MFAEIILNKNSKELNKVFDYIIPKELEKNLKLGDRVLVPFGANNKLIDGIVTNIKNTSQFANKDIAEIKNSYLSKEDIEFAKLMARRYFCNEFECIKLMLPPGTLSKEIDNWVKEKTEKFVYLSKNEEEINEDIINKKIKSPKHQKVLKYLIDKKDKILVQDLEKELEVSKNILKTIEKHGYIEIKEEIVKRNPFKNKNVKRDTEYVLNGEQQYAFFRVSELIKKEEFQEFLLYGVTGSGKTEVYLQLIRVALEQNKTAIMLVPEISLTSQTVNRVIARFGEDIVAVLHSRLSVGERYDEWQKIYNGEAKIVIGARSAIFAPVKNLGLIIIDEEHDTSYKSEMSPKFDARDIAKFICKNNKCPLILGSATPDLKTFYEAKEKDKIEILELTKRTNSSKLPDVEIIDLRDELVNGNTSMISVKLYKEIEENIKNKRQTILFLNRRGFSTYVLCADCGATVKCKNCNINLTYHQKENVLKCHYCGYKRTPIIECDECKSKNIKYMGSGTQKLDAEINRLFPEASTIRMDVDTTSRKNSHEEILEKFKNENIDILIGTQMVVKGHHFPNVTLVGVILADNSLNIEDFRAQERTFQILTQVAGRAGRGELPRKSYNTNI